jgi:hypothetical protein
LVPKIAVSGKTSHGDDRLGRPRPTATKKSDFGAIKQAAQEQELTERTENFVFRSEALRFFCVKRSLYKE